LLVREGRNHGQETKSESEPPPKKKNPQIYGYSCRRSKKHRIREEEVESTTKSSGWEEGDERIGKLTSRIKNRQVDEVETTDD